VIAVEDLSFGYRRADPPVLSGLTHSFIPGLTVVVGPSGCGKSTLLYLLGLMLRPSGGWIRLNGSDVARLPDQERSRLRAQHMGFVFQDAVLDPSRSILANVCESGLYAGMPRATREGQALELLRRFGIAEHAADRPGEISGGQAQRVGLCRALLTSPSVILADEPSGNLDWANADLVWATLHHAASDGVTVVVATHDSTRASLADAVLALP
jgi:lipoprotein-releasing system ATP-binding protein